MIKTEEIGERIRKFVISNFPAAKRRGVTLQDALLGSGMIDSLGILELVDFLERSFGFALDEEDLSPENFQTIEQLASFVAVRLNGQNNSQAST
jgi:acyl carrier protein